MQINFKRPFVNFVKKSKKPFQLIIEDKIDFIKRCIGLPGDRIKFDKGVLFINGFKW